MVQYRPQDLPRLRDELVRFGRSDIAAKLFELDQMEGRIRPGRSQWGRGRQLRRPVWISPFVKGPEGAPMLGGEKVYVLDRGPATPAPPAPPSGSG